MLFREPYESAVPGLLLLEEEPMPPTLLLLMPPTPPMPLLLRCFIAPVLPPPPAIDWSSSDDVSPIKGDIGAMALEGMVDSRFLFPAVRGPNLPFAPIPPPPIPP